MSNAPSNTDKPHVPGKNPLRSFLLSVKEIRWTYACIAFCLAVTLWYAVTVRDKVETWVDVAVQFKGAPANLIIREGLINKLAVRVRAARGLSSSLAGREASMVVDLSTITRGSNAITVTRGMLPFTSAFEVVEVSPARILIAADTTASREIELKSTIEGRLAPDLFVESLRLDTPKVTVSGAESLVSSIPQLVLPIVLAPDMIRGHNILTVAVPVPANVTVTPPQVGIDVVVGLRTKTLKLVRDVVVVNPAGDKTLSITPDKVSLVVNMPESLVRDPEALRNVVASVSLPPDFTGEPKTHGVTVSVPENAELVSVMPAEVTVAGSQDESEASPGNVPSPIL